GLPFIADGLGGRRVSIRRYAVRRALRILPLYYTAVAVGTAVAAHSAADLLRGVPYLLFLNGFANQVTPLRPFSNVWWSLATEVQFYALLPLLAHALRTRRGRIAGLLALAIYGAAYVAMVVGLLKLRTVEGQFALMQSIFARGPLFLWGILGAWMYH